MAHLVHACRITDGDGRRVVYRVWSTVVDAYLTDPMSEAELRAWLRLDVIDLALQSFDREVEGLVERARENGTSSRGYGERSMDRWEKERG